MKIGMACTDHAARYAPRSCPTWSSEPGIRWPYRLKVISMLAWPITTLSAFALARAAIIRLAAWVRGAGPKL